MQRYFSVGMSEIVLVSANVIAINEACNAISPLRECHSISIAKYNYEFFDKCIKSKFINFQRHKKKRIYIQNN